MKKSLLKGLSLLLLISLLLTFLSGAALAATVKGKDGKTYIRSAPSLDAKILGTLPKGASAEYVATTVDGRNVKWYKITYNGLTGWVSSMYTTFNGSNSFNADHGNVWGVSGNSYIRSQPNLNGKVLGTLPKGERANYLGESSTDNRGVVWYKITYETTTGWVSSKYTSRKSSSSSGSSGGSSSGSKPASSRVVVGTGGKSNIRSAPRLSGKDIGTLPKGASATYLNESSTDDRGVVWYHISYKGTKGWVSSKYTTLK